MGITIIFLLKISTSANHVLLGHHTHTLTTNRLFRIIIESFRINLK